MYQRGLKHQRSRFRADALDPGCLVYGEEGAGYHALDAVLFHSEAYGAGKIVRLSLFDPFSLYCNQRESGRLCLQWHEVDIGDVEHVALFVPGPDRDKAGHLLLLDGKVAGKP